MKALTLTPNCYCIEDDVKPTTKTKQQVCKADDFAWHCYLKQEKNHNIALSLFNK